MDAETIKSELDAIMESLRNDQADLETCFEKLLVATSNVFRLVDGQGKTLLALQGSPKELHGYVLNLITEIREKTAENSDQVLTELTRLIRHLAEENCE